MKIDQRICIKQVVDINDSEGLGTKKITVSIRH